MPNSCWMCATSASANRSASSPKYATSSPCGRYVDPDLSMATTSTSVPSARNASTSAPVYPATPQGVSHVLSIETFTGPWSSIASSPRLERSDAPAVLHLCPDERSVGGVAAYSEVFREGLQADAAFTLREVRNYAAMATELAAGRVDVLQAEIAGGSAHELAAVRKVLHRTQTPVVLTVHDPPRLIWTPFLGRMLRDRR